MDEKEIEQAQRPDGEPYIGGETSEAPKVDPEYYCNSRRSDKGTFLGYCKNRAGKQTEHFGDGRCWLHGGNSPRGDDSPNFKHGLFSDYLDDDERETIDVLEQKQNAEKLQTIIDWRIARLRRAVRKLNDVDEETEEPTNIYEAFQTLVDRADKMESDEIKELAAMLGRNEDNLQREIDQIRKMIKTHNDISEGQKVNIDADVSSQVSGPGGSPLSISWTSADDEESDDE